MQIYFKGNLIASHPRITGFGMSTTSTHMPTRHERHQKWTPTHMFGPVKCLINIIFHCLYIKPFK